MRHVAAIDVRHGMTFVYQSARRHYHIIPTVQPCDASGAFVRSLSYPQGSFVQGTVVGQLFPSVVVFFLGRLEPYARHLVEQTGGHLRRRGVGIEIAAVTMMRLGLIKSSSILESAVQ